MAKEVKVKITADNKDLFSAITSAVGRIRSFATQVTGVKDVKVAADGTAKSLKDVGIAADNAGSAVKRAGQQGASGMKDAKDNAAAFGQTLANVTIIAHGVFSVLSKIKDAVKSAVAPGVDYTKQMESARVGVAGILLSMTKLNGEQLTLNQALNISEQTFDELMQKSLQFNLNINDTAAAFQAIVGQGLGAKMTLEEIVAFAVQGTKAVKSFGLDSMQVVQELRSMVSGDINADSQIAKAMGITATDIAEAKQTAGGLFQYLNDKLKGFTLVAGEIPKTIKGKSDMLNAALSLVSEQGFKPLIEAGKEVFDSIINYLVITTAKTDEFGKTTKKVEVNPELVATLKTVSEYIIKTAQNAYSLGKALYNGLSPVAPLLKLIADHILTITVLFAGWVVAKTIISILQGINAAAIVLEGSIVAVTKAIRAGTVATQASTVAMGGLKVAIRGLLASSIIGLLVVGVGMLAEKMLNLADNTDKAAKANRKFKIANGDYKESDFGWLSSNHEGDSDTISSGDWDTYGGKSYGAWQISSKQGTLGNFVQWLLSNGYEAGPFLAYGENKQAGIPAHSVDLASPEFDALWHQAVEKFGDSFYRAQKEFIKETHYNPANEMLINDFGFDANARSSAMQEVLWSTAVQHGPGASGVNDRGAWAVFSKAAELAGVPNVSWLTDEQLIPFVYQARKALNPSDSQRYTVENDEAMQFLATHPQRSTTPIDTSGLATDPVQTAKELKDAEINFLNAQRAGIEKKYIADLEQQEGTWKQKFDSKEIGYDEYYQQMRTIIINKSYAQIETAKTAIDAETEKLSNKNYDSADKQAAKTKIQELRDDIKVKQTELQTALNSNSYESQQAALEEQDKALDAQIEVLKLQGKLEEAAKLEQQKSDNVKKIAEFTVNKAADGLAAYNKASKANLITARVQEATTSIENVQDDMSRSQEFLIRDIVNGTVSIEDAIAQFKTEYTQQTADALTKLKQSLQESKDIGWDVEVREIDGILRNMRKYMKDYFADISDALDTELENKLQKIESDIDLTILQKSDASSATKLDFLKQKLAAAQVEAGGVPTAKQQETIDKLKEQITQLERLADTTEKVKIVSKQAFEDGLLDYLSRGIFECKNLGDAIRNLSITVLQSIQKVYAEAMTKNIMSLLGMGSSRPQIGNQPVQGPLKADGTFADGGTFIDSFGKIHGPGTGTSDSILAFSGLYGKILNVGNAEGIITAKGLKNIGSKALAAINAGVDPRKIFRSYATGGVISSKAIASMPGPQELAANLSSDTTIPLNIMNILDPGLVERSLKTRPGKKAIMNIIKDEIGTIQKMMTIKG